MKRDKNQFNVLLLETHKTLWIIKNSLKIRQNKILKTRKDSVKIKENNEKIKTKKVLKFSQVN
jgi:tetraacyldisaccharide-1-P 4'-kinase